MPHKEMDPPVRRRRRAGRRRGGGGRAKEGGEVTSNSKYWFPTSFLGGKVPESEARSWECGASLPVKSVFSVGQYEQAGNEVGRTDFVGKPD